MTALKTEVQVAKKRDDDEEDKAKFNCKKQKLQDEESALMEQLKYDEVVLQGIEERAEKSSNLVEVRSSMAAGKSLKEKSKRKQESLSQIVTKKK